MDKNIFNSKYAYEINDMLFYIDNGRIYSDYMDIDDNPGYILANLFDVKVIGRVVHDECYPDEYCIFTESDKAFINGDGELYNIDNFIYGVQYSDIINYFDNNIYFCNILGSDIKVNWELIQFLEIEDKSVEWFVNKFSSNPSNAGYKIYNYEEICNWIDKYQLNKDYTITDGKLTEINLKTSWDIYYMIHDALLVDNEPDYKTVTKINDILIKNILLKM